MPPLTSPCSRYSTFAGGSASATYNFESSAYAEDRWLINDRLLFEPGIRLDWDEIIRAPLVSPRLAGTYVLDNSGNTKLSAGIGLIYDPSILFLIARPLAGQRTDYFFNSMGMPTDANGNLTAAPIPVPTTFSADRNSLEAPRYVNWSVGLERKLPAAIYLKAEFLEKRGSHGFVYNAPTNAGDNFLLENTRDDRYDALELTLRHNFRGSYMLMGSYTDHAHTPIRCSILASIIRCLVRNCQGRIRGTRPIAFYPGATYRCSNCPSFIKLKSLIRWRRERDSPST